MELTHERLTELFSYHVDGYLVNKTDRGRTAKKGQRAGRGTPKSYRQIKVDGKIYREHQLIWFFFNFKMPKLVDHIDHDIHNNKITNLREVTHKENIRHGSGRQAGIFRHKNGKYLASIYVDCVRKHLGSFNTYGEALDRRKQAEKEYWIWDNA